MVAAKRNPIHLHFRPENFVLREYRFAFQQNVRVKTIYVFYLYIVFSETAFIHIIEHEMCTGEME